MGVPAVFAGLLAAVHETRAAQPAETSIQFLSANDARAAIVDESKEPYFKLMQSMEMAAKTGSPVPGDTLDQQRAECRKRYQQAVQDFTPEEKDAVQWYVSKIAPAATSYPVFARTPWSFIKVSPQIEGGQPFTRGRHIVVSSLLLSSMILERKKAAVRTERADAEWLALAPYGDVLIHEQCHVVQRQHPEAFAWLYTEFWGFKHAGKIDGDAWLTEHQLLDPDGTDQRWVFPIKVDQGTRWIWPLMVIQDGEDPSGPSFKDARQIAIEVEPAEGDGFRVKTGPNGRILYRGLMNETRYVSVFRPSRDAYHPNEAAADLFARIMMVENILPDRAPAEAKDALAKAKVMYKPLQQWFAKILGAEHS